MIISNILGGLGNQMFQYACGRAVSLRTGQSLRLAVDQLGRYQQHNGFELQRVFNVNTQLANVKEMVSLLGFKAHPKIRSILGRPSMSWLTGGNWCNEPYFDCWPEIFKIRRSIYLHGYWQSEQYFADIANVIRDDFTFKSDLDVHDLAVLNKMSLSPCASLHVRRGDYLKGKFRNVYATCDISYYLSAVEYLRNRIPNIKLFVFSDDPNWVVRHLEPELGSIEVVSHNSGIRSSNDMRLMSAANHHIIANSSFSWWGAWLNPSIKKIVIAPSKWFVDARSTSNLIPKSWIRL
jgi:Glycosyl transferase family 11